MDDQMMTIMMKIMLIIIIIIIIMKIVDWNDKDLVTYDRQWISKGNNEDKINDYYYYYH